MGGLPSVVVFGALIRPQHLMMLAAAVMFGGWRGVLVGGILCEWWLRIGTSDAATSAASKGTVLPASELSASTAQCTHLHQHTGRQPSSPSCSPHPAALCACAGYVWMANGAGQQPQGQQQQPAGQQQNRVAAAQDYFRRMLPPGQAEGGGSGSGSAARQSTDPWAGKGKAYKLSE